MIEKTIYARHSPSIRANSRIVSDWPPPDKSDFSTLETLLLWGGLVAHPSRGKAWEIQDFK
jgi:hypothetical protein